MRLLSDCNGLGSYSVRGYLETLLDAVKMCDYAVNFEFLISKNMFNGSAIMLCNWKKVLKGKISMVLGLIESLKKSTFSFKIFFTMVNVCISEHYLSLGVIYK